MIIKFEPLEKHVFVTKLAGFEHSMYIQNNQTKLPKNQDDIPLVQGKNIRNGFFVEKYDWYIQKEISDKLQRSKLTKRCILVPYVGSNLGEVGIFYHNYDCHLASNIAKIELIDDYFDIEYLKYYLQSPIGQAYLFQAKQGSAQPNITMESIRKTNIIDCSKDEQIKIAEVLKSIDKKIINNHKIIFETESMLKTIYDYWFLQFEFPNHEGNPYKSSNGKMVWSEKIKRHIPQGWEPKKIRDILIESNKSSIQVNQSKEKGKYPFFTSGESIFAYDDYFVDGFNIFLNTGGNPDIKAFMGKCAYSTDTWCVSAEKYSFILYYYFLKIMPQFEQLFFAGSGLKHLQKDVLKNIYLLLPDTKTLKIFNDFCFSGWKRITNCSAQNQNLSELRNFLMPLLLNGQVTI